MNLAVVIQSGYPAGKARHFVSTLRPGTVLWVPPGGPLRDLVASTAAARGLLVHRAPVDHPEVESMAVLRDARVTLEEEVTARGSNLPIVVFTAKVWG